MTTVSALYNNLPSLWEADKKFGVCLVHRHCTLEEGEMMVASGNVSQPERDVPCNPDRWLASGEPYEFTRKETCPPPQELLDEFQKIVDGIEVLGLFYVQDEDRSGVAVEKTEGRMNVVEILPHDQSSDSICISTGWLLLPDYNDPDSTKNPQSPLSSQQCHKVAHVCFITNHS